MNQLNDPCGLPHGTINEAAASACDAGIDSFVRWRVDTMTHLDTAIEADDGFALPRITKAWILHAARNAGYAPQIGHLMTSARQCVNPDDVRAREHLAALDYARTGRAIECATVFEAWLGQYPTDLLAHRLVQFELFWNGRAAWMRDIANNAESHWHDGLPGYGSLLSVRAFSNEEAGAYDIAERCG